MSRDRVTLARIGAPHGVRGEVRLKSFAEVPEDAAAYGPLTDSRGRTLFITALRAASGPQHDMLVVKFDGIDDRDAAAELTGVELSVERSKLPPPGEDDAYYHADLIGLGVFRPAGDVIGQVVAVSNYGAGDLLEIKPAHGGTFLIPFTKDNVPEVDLEAGRVIVDPPPGMLPDPPTAEEGT